MPSKNKLRGTYYERKCVEHAQKFDLKAERTWGSDGRSRGLHQEVDMVLEDTIYIQCKKRKKLAEHLMPIEDTCSICRRRQGKKFSYNESRLLLKFNSNYKGVYSKWCK